MSGHIGLPEALTEYVLRHTREDGLAARQRQETLAMPQARMITTPDQAQFLALLVRLTGARRVLEVGTFTGYGTLAMAQALGEGGQIITCDMNIEYTAIARRYWQEAGLEDRIELRLAPAEKTLAALVQEKYTGMFDLAFIDADKSAYDGYYESCLRLLRPGGLVVFDNMLWSGRVADAGDMSADTQALRALNAKIHCDARVEASLLTVADGMMLARKR